jgi:Dna[CI] antecedent DciA-like protein
MSGLRSLRTLVAAWKPGGASSTADSAGAIAAAWSDVVGPAVATRTRPAGVRNGILTIWTAGSAWSAELSFLEPSILASLQSIVPNAGVTRVRFSVASGRTKRLLDGAVARVPRTERPARSREDETVDEAEAPRDAPSELDLTAIVGGMRDSQRALDARRARDGWTRCTICGAWTPPRTSSDLRCVRCAEEERQSADQALARALADAPWQTPREFIATIPGADRAAYERVRRRLLANLEVQLDGARRRLRRGTLEAADRVAAWTYVMLIARKPKRAVPRAVVADVLDEMWADALGLRANAPRREARAAP